MLRVRSWIGCTRHRLCGSARPTTGGCTSSNLRRKQEDVSNDAMYEHFCTTLHQAHAVRVRAPHHRRMHLVEPAWRNALQMNTRSQYNSLLHCQDQVMRLRPSNCHHRGFHQQTPHLITPAKATRRSLRRCSFELSSSSPHMSNGTFLLMAGVGGARRRASSLNHQAATADACRQALQ